MTSMTASEARAALPELLTRVEQGDEVTITRHGRPVAVLVSPGALRSRQVGAVADAERIHELLAGAATVAIPEHDGLTAERADELIREIRAGREAR
ncbi:MAG TPA: type II toxin-antitoxin system Phd/YefM family antitoxin [Streptosporangiaceae bacterium]|nr:type II toxin-antitoxin system Phd/YefM family antitoxin [Streptosporangiaceae bacterium]